MTCQQNGPYCEHDEVVGVLRIRVWHNRHRDVLACHVCLEHAKEAEDWEPVSDADHQERVWSQR